MVKRLIEGTFNPDERMTEADRNITDERSEKTPIGFLHDLGIAFFI